MTKRAIGLLIILLGVGVLLFWGWQARSPGGSTPSGSDGLFASVDPDSSPTPKSILLGDASPSPQQTPSTASQWVRANAQSVLLTPEQTPAWKLDTRTEKALPTRLACAQNALYFLARGQLHAINLTAIKPRATLQPIPLTPNAEHRLPTGERIRELMALVATGPEELILLDKSNDLYRFETRSKRWSFAVKAKPSPQQPDPHYIALASWQDKAYILDYARNQIQRYVSGRLSSYFPREVMSWDIQPSDHNVVDGIDLHIDGDAWVLSRSGAIARYRNGRAVQAPIQVLNNSPALGRPLALRALRGDSEALYVVDAGNRRIVKISKKTGTRVQEWIFAGLDPAWDQLHDVASCRGQLWALAGQQLIQMPAHSDLEAAPVPATSAPVDPYLQGWIPPVPGAELPDNEGIYPGARRLYRYGIHEGADFFDRQNPQTGGKQVRYGSPVVAVQKGRILRIDHAFQEMKPDVYARVLAACAARHETSREHENLFRGQQVWIAHDGGIVTLYAHLSAVSPSLKPGDSVAQGQEIGQVGNSGTSNSIAGNQGSPHLHLEIWLSAPDDPIQGEYLGKWRSLAETRELWENLFQKARVQ